MAQSPKTSQDEASLTSKVRSPSRRQCSLYGLNLQLDNGGGRSHSGLRWIASRDGSQPTCAIILIDSLSLLQKVKNGKGIKPRLTCVNVQYPPAETLVGVLPWACWSDGKLWPSRRTGGQSNHYKRFASCKNYPCLTTYTSWNIDEKQIIQPVPEREMFLRTVEHEKLWKTKIQQKQNKHPLFNFLIFWNLFINFFLLFIYKYFCCWEKKNQYSFT